MTTAITTQAQKELKALLNMPEIQAPFARVLGDNAGAFVSSILTLVNNGPEKLRFADPMSIINCALLAASLELQVNASLGQCWIIPYENKREGLIRAQFQLGYKGIVQLGLRSNEYRKIEAFSVPEGITVSQDYRTGEITTTGEPTSDKVKGFMSYIELRNGYNHNLYMTMEEVRAHAERYSKSWENGKPMKGSPWDTSFETMAWKTVLKPNILRYGIISVKMARGFDAEEKETTKVDMSDLIVDGVEYKDKPEEPRKLKPRGEALKELGFSTTYDDLLAKFKVDPQAAWLDLTRALGWSTLEAETAMRDSGGDRTKAFTQVMRANKELLSR